MVYAVHCSPGSIVTLITAVNDVLFMDILPAVYTVTSGVPQGSILGLLLFLVYVNDLPAVIDSRAALFADDSKCTGVIKEESDCAALQDDLNSLNYWSQAWQLRFNSSKCEILTVSRKKDNYDCNLDSKSLNHVSTIKDLGVVVSNDLKWNNYMDHILAKGYRILSFLKRHTLKSFDENTRKLLYLSFVRPHIGYAQAKCGPLRRLAILLAQSAFNAELQNIF